MKSFGVIQGNIYLEFRSQSKYLYYILFPVSVNGGSDSDTANDLMLAQMLQLQFDEEYEKSLKARENRMNGTSKGITTCMVEL